MRPNPERCPWRGCTRQATIARFESLVQTFDELARRSVSWARVVFFPAHADLDADVKSVYRREANCD